METTFILKKVVGEMLNPLSIGLIIAFIGVLALYGGRQRTAKFLLPFAFLWIALLSYGPISALLLNPLERQYPALLESPVGVDYILVLGNEHHTNKNLPITAQVSATAIVRLSEGIRHYQKLPGSTLVLSGYAGLEDENSHALMQKRLAVALGVDGRDIKMLTSPKDTQEEAEAMKKLVGNTPFILVTSASHMPRAMQLFNDLGMHPVAAPTDYHAQEKSSWLHMPRSDGLRSSGLAFHEYYGSIWNWIKR